MNPVLQALSNQGLVCREFASPKNQLLLGKAHAYLHEFSAFEMGGISLGSFGALEVY